MRNRARCLLLLALVATAAPAFAHPGHGASGWWDGLVHPLGVDHLLTALAAGVWAAAAMPHGRRIVGPAVFMLALIAGASLAFAGVSGPWIESGVALGVLLAGALLFAPRDWSATLGLAIVSAVALLHGLAHGSEWIASGGALAYALGFVLTTALLQGAGLALGLALQRTAQATTWRVMGSGLGLAGLYWLAQS